MISINCEWGLPPYTCRCGKWFIFHIEIDNKHYKI